MLDYRNHVYVLSPKVVMIPVDEHGKVLAPMPSVEDLLILKLLRLRDRDMADAIGLILDNPDIDAAALEHRSSPR